ncbi:peptide deformylase 1B, chloroplastic [Andrographis paniculata]|uniref:peptide deformylase 1B, chloroplastic n=1 Tax=Andrographis paniculata TaxID=175694 RepID=UPI0021E95987|nr:peptide deformylase 1B, chloroplastic [Andrographis paniculata]
MVSAAFLHAAVPVLRRRSAALDSSFCNLRRFTSESLFASSSRRCKRFVRPIFAQARRGFSSVARGEAVASPADLRFESPLKIVLYPDPVLRAKNKKVNTFDESLKKLADEMFDVMYRTDGIGLSAPQVGVTIQLMVFNAAGEIGEGEEVVLVNPRINRYSKKIVPYNEGCLSFPGIYADVERPDSLKVDAQDITGAKFEMSLSGLSARVFQHEYDHLKGVLFFDRMSDEVLDSIREELQVLEKKYEENTRLTSPEKIDVQRPRGRRKKAVGFGKS